MKKLLSKSPMLTAAIFCVVTVIMVSVSWVAWAAKFESPSGEAGTHKFGQMFIGRWDDDDSASVLAITNSSQQYTIPDLGDSYIISAIGNSVEILCGSNPTAVAATTRSLVIPEGGYSPRLFFDCVDADGDTKCDARKCAYIAGASGGFVTFMRFQNDIY